MSMSGGDEKKIDEEIKASKDISNPIDANSVAREPARPKKTSPPTVTPPLTQTIPVTEPAIPVPTQQIQPGVPQQSADIKITLEDQYSKQNSKQKQSGTTLTSFDLSMVEINDDNVDIIEIFLKKHPEIKTLNLANNTAIQALKPWQALDQSRNINKTVITAQQSAISTTAVTTPQPQKEVSTPQGLASLPTQSQVITPTLSSAPPQAPSITASPPTPSSKPAASTELASLSTVHPSLTTNTISAPQTPILTATAQPLAPAPTAPRPVTTQVAQSDATTALEIKQKNQILCLTIKTDFETHKNTWGKIVKAEVNETPINSAPSVSIKITDTSKSENEKIAAMVEAAKVAYAASKDSSPLSFKITGFTPEVRKKLKDELLQAGVEVNLKDYYNAAIAVGGDQVSLKEEEDRDVALLTKIQERPAPGGLVGVSTGLPAAGPTTVPPQSLPTTVPPPQQPPPQQPQPLPTQPTTITTSLPTSQASNLTAAQERGAAALGQKFADATNKNSARLMQKVAANLPKNPSQTEPPQASFTLQAKATTPTQKVEDKPDKTVPTDVSSPAPKHN